MDRKAEDSNGELQRAAIQRELVDKLQGHRDYLKSLNEAPSSSGQSCETATEPSKSSNGAVSQSAQISFDPQAPALPLVSVHNDQQAPIVASAGSTTQSVTLDGQMAEEQQLEPDVRHIPPSQRRRSRCLAASGAGLMKVHV